MVYDQSNSTDLDEDLSGRLRQETCGCRLIRRRFGTARAASKSQHHDAAEVFGAEDDVLRLKKILVNTRDERYRAVTTIISRAVGLWRAISVPYPESGIRLIRRDQVTQFNEVIEGLSEQLGPALEALQQAWPIIKAEAKERLGDLWNPSDYPDSIGAEFGIEVDYPNLSPPEYLKQLNPALYEEQARRVKAQFDTAIHMAESAFAKEFRTLLDSLVEKLAPTEEGEKRRFNAKAVTKLKDFTERFKELNFRNNSELAGIIEKCEAIVAGENLDELKSSAYLRASLGQSLGALAGELAKYVETGPTRGYFFDEDEAKAEAAGLTDSAVQGSEPVAAS